MKMCFPVTTVGGGRGGGSTGAVIFDAAARALEGDATARVIGGVGGQSTYGDRDGLRPDRGGDGGGDGGCTGGRTTGSDRDGVGGNGSGGVGTWGALLLVHLLVIRVAEGTADAPAVSALVTITPALVVWRP